ncbi:hypothetical protein LJB88_05275 [Erysipelotrichaceae bacterium OttesenSCG-928-M19]|nr:hypothetical protein [Erysipelotrichaceae bacterium OttesenSCG-928-M19]
MEKTTNISLIIFVALYSVIVFLGSVLSEAYLLTNPESKKYFITFLYKIIKDRSFLIDLPNYFFIFTLTTLTFAFMKSFHIFLKK